MSIPPQPSLAAGRSIVLVGGGRWGRVHAGVLRGLLSPASRLLWVSTHSQAELARQLAGGDDSGPEVSVFANLGEALSQKLDAAIIVTAAHTHAEVTREVLKAGVPALVEKPLALDPIDAVELIDLAARQRLVLGIGLHLMTARYLQRFGAMCEGREIATAHIAWLDPEREVRYGEIKKANFSTSKAHDVYPHLFAILCVLFPGFSPQISNVESALGGAAKLSLSIGRSDVTAEIARRGPQRTRRIDVRFADGGSASLDFTEEPGSIVFDDGERESDPDWGRGMRPLAAEVAGFLTVIHDEAAAAAWPLQAAKLIGSVTGAAEIASRLTQSDARLLARALASGGDIVTDAALRSLVLENLTPELAPSGLRLDPDGEGRLIEATRAVLMGRPLAASSEGGISSALYQRVLHSDFLQLVKDRIGNQAFP